MAITLPLKPDNTIDFELLSMMHNAMLDELSKLPKPSKAYMKSAKKQLKELLNKDEAGFWQP